MVMTVLVTGGGGFLGSAIVRRLAARGDEVRSLSRSRYPELKLLKVEQIQGDIVDENIVAHAAEGCDLVFHVAAKAGLGGRYSDYEPINVTGTKNVLEACRQHKVPRLVYTSSPSVVFDGRDMEGVNESVPYPPRHDAAYPQSKMVAEKMVRAANSPTLATVALRPHLIWGPGDNHLVPRIVERGRAGKLRRIGTKVKLIDSTYIDNAADAHIRAGDRLNAKSPLAGKAYFISNGEPMPIWDLINGILAAADEKPVMKVTSVAMAYAAGWFFEKYYGLLGKTDDPPMTRFLASELSTAHWFDIGAAQRDFAYKPSVTIDQGLRKLTTVFAAAAVNER